MIKKTYYNLFFEKWEETEIEKSLGLSSMEVLELTKEQAVKVFKYACIIKKQYKNK